MVAFPGSEPQRRRVRVRFREPCSTLRLHDMQLGRPVVVKNDSDAWVLLAGETGAPIPLRPGGRALVERGEGGQIQALRL